MWTPIGGWAFWDGARSGPARSAGRVLWAYQISAPWRGSALRLRGDGQRGRTIEVWHWPGRDTPPGNLYVREVIESNCRRKWNPLTNERLRSRSRNRVVEFRGLMQPYPPAGDLRRHCFGFARPGNLCAWSSRRRRGGNAWVARPEGDRFRLPRPQKVDGHRRHGFSKLRRARQTQRLLPRTCEDVACRGFAAIPPRPPGIGRPLGETIRLRVLRSLLEPQGVWFCTTR